MIKQLGISKKITTAAELPNREHLYKNNENLEKHNKLNVSINCNELLFSSSFLILLKGNLGYNSTIFFKNWELFISIMFNDI